ncbi:acyltransferase family protein [Pontibacter actiniarum]|nr:acyltransferase [Pontibacter actiniarum]
MNLKLTRQGYMVQLDGLRAIAVTAVVLFHWTPEVKQTGFGGLGVQLFFVLSGYLITGILLDARTKAEALGVAKKQVVRSFYARRFLRIFPLYYLVVILAALLGSVNIQRYLGWHLSYLSNIAIFREGHWIGEASHLWSLAVEEQFYLLWPFVILFTPRRHLFVTMGGFILLAPAFKLACLLLEVGGSRAGVLPISSLHYLGAGALLALCEKSRSFRGDARRRDKFAAWIQAGGVAGLVIFGVLQLTPGLLKSMPVLGVCRDFAVISLFSSITFGAAQGFKGIAGRLLSSRPMRYVGQISYGLYLFHNFVPYFTERLLQQLGVGTVNRPLLLTVEALVLVGLSVASWHLFEKKLNRYKDSFPYVAVPAKAVGQP